MSIRTFVAKSRTFVAKSEILFSENDGRGSKAVQNFSENFRRLFEHENYKKGLFRVCFSTNYHVELLYYVYLMGNMII